MDPLNFDKTVAKLQQTLDDQQQQIKALEAQVAKDVNAIADKVIAAVMPEVAAVRASADQLTLVISSSVTETLSLLRRVNGASFTMALGPEVQ